MTTLELTSIEDLIAEAGDKETVRVAEIETPLQDPKGEDMTGFLLVLTCRKDDYIIKLVETIGSPAYNSNRKDIESLAERRNERVKAIRQLLANKGVRFGKGLWQ